MTARRRAGSRGGRGDGSHQAGSRSSAAASSSGGAPRLSQPRRSRARGRLPRRASHRRARRSERAPGSLPSRQPLRYGLTARPMAPYPHQSPRTRITVDPRSKEKEKETFNFRSVVEEPKQEKMFYDKIFIFCRDVTEREQNGVICRGRIWQLHLLHSHPHQLCAGMQRMFPPIAL